MTGNLWRRLVWSEKEYHKEIDMVSYDLNNDLELEEKLTPSTKHDKPLPKKVGPSNIQPPLNRHNLISSEEWLRIHGLKTKKLTLSQILSQIGFPHQEDYVSSIGRLVASRYANGLFRQFCKAEDGTIYRLTAKIDLIYPFVKNLTNAVECFKQRMDWLTSGSRQIFGVILDKCITIVLDFGLLEDEEFSLCQDALIMVIEEQVAHLTRFNLIRVAEYTNKWQYESVFASEDAIISAISWIKNLVCQCPVDSNSAIDALREAKRDNSVAAIYYVVVGDVLENAKKLLLRSSIESSHPIHTVSFNARGEDTITFLKELSVSTRGRFHAFAARIESVGISNSTSDGEIYFSSNIRKLKGRVPPGAGVREDVYLIWRELEEARNTLGQIKKIIEEAMKPESSEAVNNFPPVKGNASVETLRTSTAKVSQKLVEESADSKKEKKEEPEPSPKPSMEDYLDSKKWLQKYGLKAQKLTAFDILADCSFRHVDGVVDIKGRPDNVYLQTCAETNKKNVHAKYCNKFVHTPWKDGTMVHVYVTADKCKAYEEKMSNALEYIERRIKWLQNGSQGLFGIVLADYIYILIDTSHSMKGKLPLVKEKIFQLLKEQLIFKKKFNFVKFDGKAVAWQERLAEVNADNLKMAKEWIKNLQVGSSTNTMDALKLAFADRGTRAIYILTDGRPDQPEEKIFGEIQLHKKIPIHTISFNYHDEDANTFLKDLSLMTGGEFHYFHFGSRDPTDPDAYLNEQMNLLLHEIEVGQNDLERVQTLYTESMMLDWWYNTEKEEENEYKKPTYTMLATTEKKSEVSLGIFTKRTISPSEPGFLCPYESLPHNRLKKKVPFSEPTRTSLLRNSFIGKKLSEDNWNIKKFLPPDQKEYIRKHNSLLSRKSLFEKEALKTSDENSETNTVGEKITEVRVRESSLDSLDMSSERWLKVHGLVAKRLTIMDALSSTAIPHQSKYVPILGKHVVSKVYDSIFTLKQVGSETGQMILINPHAVNLKTYKYRVEQAVKSYEKRLNLLIWKAFSPEEREKLKLQEPIQYFENREVIHRALQDANWPVSFEDVLLLENEIQAGNIYIKQAQEIQEATKKDNNCRGDQPCEVSPTVPGKAVPCRLLALLPVQTPRLSPGGAILVEEGSSILSIIQTNCQPTAMEGQADLGGKTLSRTLTLLPIQIPHSLSKETPSVEKGPTIPATTTTGASSNHQPTVIEGKGGPRVLETAVTPGPPALLFIQTPPSPVREACPRETGPATNANCQATEGQINPRDPGTVGPLKPLSLHLSSNEVSSMEMGPVINISGQTTTMHEKGSPKDPGTAVLIMPVALSPSGTLPSCKEAFPVEKGHAPPPTSTTNDHSTAKEGGRRKTPSPLEVVFEPVPNHSRRSSCVGEHHLQGKPSISIIKHTKNRGTSTRSKKVQGPGKKFKCKRVDPLRGQKVIARSEENGFYFPGTVVKCVSPTHALVEFKYGESRVVPIVFITPVGGAMPCPILQVGDYVFAKIVIPKGYDFYVPAIIIATPNRDEPSDKFYTVLKCNNRRDFCLRSGLIKISQNKYALSCSFIKTTPMKEPPRANMEDAKYGFMYFPYEEIETGPLRDEIDENPKRNKNKKKSDIKKHSREVLSSDSEDSAYEAEMQMFYSKAKGQPKGGGNPDSVSKEKNNKYTKCAHRVKTYPKCQGQCKTLRNKKQSI